MKRPGPGDKTVHILHLYVRKNIEVLKKLSKLWWIGKAMDLDIHPLCV